MLDIFGLHKESGAKPAENPVTNKTAANSGAKAWWALFLALDTACLCAFGGATIVLWLHHPRTPISVPPPKIQRALPKSQTTQAAAPSAQQAAPKTEPGKPPEPAAAKQAPAAKSKELPAKGPVGSPSVAAPELPRRQTQPAGGNSASATQPAAPPEASSTPGAKPKARPVEFSCSASSSAKQVLLKGPFLVRSSGVKPMVSGSDGVWRLTISLLPGSYKYRCVVDGKRSKPYAIDVQ